jgi:hypothetical protein
VARTGARCRIRSRRIQRHLAHFLALDSAPPGTLACDPPSPQACLVEATAQATGQAMERGDLVEAKRLPENALLD